jgi:hypothetical protein
MALAPSFYLPLRLEGLDTCLDLPAFSLFYPCHFSETKHSSGLPVLVVDFGQEPRPISPSPWRHVRGTRCVRACSTGTEVVSGIGFAWKLF